MQLMYNVQNEDGHTICYTRSREMLLETLKKMSLESIQPLTIITEGDSVIDNAKATEWIIKEMEAS